MLDLLLLVAPCIAAKHNFVRYSYSCLFYGSNSNAVITYLGTIMVFDDQRICFRFCNYNISHQMVAMLHSVEE